MRLARTFSTRLFSITYPPPHRHPPVRNNTHPMQQTDDHPHRKHHQHQSQHHRAFSGYGDQLSQKRYVERWLDDRPEFVEQYLREKRGKTAPVPTAPLVATPTVTPITTATTTTAIICRGSGFAAQQTSATERDLLYDIVADIAGGHVSSGDAIPLCRRILRGACVLIGASRCSMFLVDGRELVSELFDVTAGSEVRHAPSAASAGFHQGERKIRLPIDVGILGEVATTGITANVMDAYSVSYRPMYRGAAKWGGGGGTGGYVPPTL